MIRPTLRLLLIFAAGIPLALLIVVYKSGLWALAFDYALLVLIVGASDLALACSVASSGRQNFGPWPALYRRARRDDADDFHRRISTRDPLRGDL